MPEVNTERKNPNNTLLREIGMALNEAKHRNVAEHMVAGFLWSLYPEWFDEFYDSIHREYERFQCLRCGTKFEKGGITCPDCGAHRDGY